MLLVLPEMEQDGDRIVVESRCMRRFKRECRGLTDNKNHRKKEKQKR